MIVVDCCRFVRTYPETIYVPFEVARVLSKTIQSRYPVTRLVTNPERNQLHYSTSKNVTLSLVNADSSAELDDDEVIEVREGTVDMVKLQV